MVANGAHRTLRVKSIAPSTQWIKIPARGAHVLQALGQTLARAELTRCRHVP